MGSVPLIIENAYERQIRHVRRMGISLSVAFMLLWFGTMVLVRVRPDWFGLMPIAMCQ